MVTKKSDKQGKWILIGDIRVRFPSNRSTSSTYEQQRSQHNNKDTRAGRLLTYNGQVCPVLIPTGHTNEASELHKLHNVCVAFRGRDGGNLLQLFRDILSAIYENIITVDNVEEF